MYRPVRHGVMWDNARELGRNRALGVDEIQWQHGQPYPALVYQIDAGMKRLLYVLCDRTADDLKQFFDVLGEERVPRLKFVYSDIWQAYLETVAREAPHACPVLDRCHIVANMNNAIDQIRTAEAIRLQADGYDPVLKHSRRYFLKCSENLTDKPTVKLSEVLQYYLREVRAFLHTRERDRVLGIPERLLSGGSPRANGTRE